MTIDISRRNFIKLGTVFGISVMIGRLPDAFAVEINSGPGPTDWMSPDGKVRYRWDAVRKVAGQKDFARDFRARDLPGWPREQAHAFFIKATRADRTFEGVDLSILGSELQPERLVLHENLAGDGVTMPQAEGLAADFYGKNFLVPKGQPPPLLGHPVALLIYRDFDTFEAAKRRLRFAENVVKYGAATGPNTPPNYTLCPHRGRQSDSLIRVFADAGRRHLGRFRRQ